MNPKVIVVAGIAAVLLIAAGVMMSNKKEVAQVQQSTAASEPLVPGFEQKVNDVAKVAIKAGTQSATLVKEGDQWVFAEKDNYPIQFDTLRKALNDVATMKKVEKKTANKEFFKKLHLQDITEEGSEAVELRAYDATGTELAAVLFGLPDYESHEKPHQFVRLAGQDQTWLVDKFVSVRTDEGSWLAKEVVNVPATDVRSVRVLHKANNEELYAFRHDPSDSNFMLATLPDGREFKRENITNEFSRILGNVNFEDVKTSGSLELAGKDIATAEIETFNGKKYALKQYEVDGEKYFTFKASLDKEYINKENERRIDEAKKQTEEAEAVAKEANEQKAAEATAATGDKAEATPAPESTTPTLEVPPIKPNLIEVASVEKEVEKENEKYAKWIYKFPPYVSDRLVRNNEFFLKELPKPGDAATDEAGAPEINNPIGEVGTIDSGSPMNLLIPTATPESN